MQGWMPQDSCDDSGYDWHRFAGKNWSSKPTSWSKNDWHDDIEKPDASQGYWEDCSWQWLQASWNENSWQRSDLESWASMQTPQGKTAWQDNDAESEALQSNWEDHDWQQPRSSWSKNESVHKDMHLDATHSSADAEDLPPPMPEHVTAAESSMETVGAQSKANEAVPSAKNRRGRGEARLWCEILLDRMRDHLQLCSLEHDFELVPMLIGVKGQKMLRIHAETKAKIRIRGRGSGHLEVDDKSQEAPVPLMCVVTADRTHADAFVKAVDMTVTEIMKVALRFQKFCRSHKQNCDVAALYRFGELSEDAKQLLLTSPLNASPLPSEIVPGVPSFAEMLQAKTCRPVAQPAKQRKKPTPRQSKQHEEDLQVNPDLHMAQLSRFHGYQLPPQLGIVQSAQGIVHSAQAAQMIAYNQSVHARFLYHYAHNNVHQPFVHSQFPHLVPPVWQEGLTGQPKPMQTEAAVELASAPEQSQQEDEPGCEEDNCDSTDEALKQAMQAQVEQFLTGTFQ